MIYLGAHMPITGGVDKAVERIMTIKGTALQIFTRNQRQWKAKPLEEEVITNFKTLRKQWGGYPVSVHDSYLINLASPKQDSVEKSVQSFATELRRTESLGIEYLVTHPGSHLGAGTDEGIKRYVENLDRAIDISGTTTVTILIENTAGQGTNLGSAFSELADIIEGSTHRERLGVCFDTCHAFAAGYDLRSPAGCEAVFAEFDRVVGIDKIRFFHLNDCKEALGANRDRHEHIGKGQIGLEGFRYIMTDSRFSDLPKVIETPKDDDPQFELDRMNLNLLRSLCE